MGSHPKGPLVAMEEERNKWRDRCIARHFNDHYPCGSCNCSTCKEFERELIKIEVQKELKEKG